MFVDRTEFSLLANPAAPSLHPSVSSRRASSIANGLCQEKATTPPESSLALSSLRPIASRFPADLGEAS